MVGLITHMHYLNNWKEIAAPAGIYETINQWSARKAGSFPLKLYYWGKKRKKKKQLTQIRKEGLDCNINKNKK